MALGSDDDGGMDDDDDDDHLEGSSGASGDELFNRSINTTLEAQEVGRNTPCTIYSVQAPKHANCLEIRSSFRELRPVPSLRLPYGWRKKRNAQFSRTHLGSSRGANLSPPRPPPPITSGF